MNAVYLLRFVLVFIVIASCTLAFKAQNDEYIFVKKLQAYTNNDLVITVEVNRNQVAVEEDVAIFITIENKGKKPIYLVKDKILRVKKEGDGPYYLKLLGPDPSDLKKGEYEYSFHDINSKKKYKDKFIIPGKLIDTHNDEYFVRIFLRFVHDKTGIDQEELKRSKDPWGMRALLSARLNTIRIGEFGLDVVVDPAK